MKSGETARRSEQQRAQGTYLLLSASAPHWHPTEWAHWQMPASPLIAPFRLHSRLGGIFVLHSSGMVSPVEEAHV